MIPFGIAVNRLENFSIPVYTAFFLFIFSLWNDFSSHESSLIKVLLVLFALILVLYVFPSLFLDLYVWNGRVFNSCFGTRILHPLNYSHEAISHSIYENLSESEKKEIGRPTHKHIGFSNLELQKVTKLELYKCRFEDLKPLAKMHWLKEITFHKCILREYGFQSLEKLKNLRALSVKECGVTDLSSLSGLKNIEHLDLSDNSIEDITALGGLTELKEINLSGNYSLHRPLDTLEKLIKLEKINLGPGSLDTRIIGKIPFRLHYLKEQIDLGTGHRMIDDLRPFKKLKELKYITIVIDPTRIYDLTALADLSQLQHLSVYCSSEKLGRRSSIKQDIVELSEEFLAPLAGLTKLEHLRINCGLVSDLTPLQGLTRLKHLSISPNFYLNREAVSDLGPLAGLQDLEHLTISINSWDIWFSDLSDLSPLSGLKNLKRLKLNNHRIKDLTPLEGLIKLEELDLEYTAINNLSPLEELKSLRDLQLGDLSYVDPSMNTEIDKLRKKLPDCSIN